MKTVIKIEKEVDLKTMHVSAGVRYWEDAVINGIEMGESWDGEGVPCKEGDLWKPIIEIETGKILNWEPGKTADIHFKVCDQCSWFFLDSEGEKYGEQTNEYVHPVLCPEKSGYGDYIIMRVDAEGMIRGWKADRVTEQFEEE